MNFGAVSLLFWTRLWQKTLKKESTFCPAVVDRLIQEEHADVKVLKSCDKWYGVTYKEDKDSVVKAIQAMKNSGKYPQVLWK